MTHKNNENSRVIELEQKLLELQMQLDEANDTIEAIRTGQVDALVVQGEKGHQLFTLKSADQTYRVFIEKMTEGAVTLNANGLILYSNSQFASMVKRDLSAVIGLTFAQFIMPGYLHVYQELFNKCWTEDCKGEVVLQSVNKNTPVQLSFTTLELEEGVSMSIILTDLTSQKETQLQLKNNNELLGAINHALELSNHDLQQFASVASHDLQEPLRKIQVFSNLLKQKYTDLPREAEIYLDKIIDSSARMKRLIIDILNYSQLSVVNHEFVLIDLNALLRELTEDFELIIDEKNATLIVGELPQIEGNKGQVRQVFQNILSNALKFAKKDTKPIISINSHRIAVKDWESPQAIDGPYFQIIIKDNGIGFDVQYVNSIFALFERLNTKTKYEGTGIGLAIAKKIIDKHHGLITATSVEGIGSEFRIILPIKSIQL